MNDAGRIGFVVRGDYVGTEAYDFLDVVYFDNSSYVAKKATIGNQPQDNSEYWQILAKGDASYERASAAYAQANNAYNLASSLNVGLYDSNSLGIGDSVNTSGGFYTTALGSNAKAAGTYTTALGSWANATGNYTTALGTSTNAIGNNATAVGYAAKASDTYTTALGFLANATANNATAVGYAANANGCGTALGASANANGTHTIAVGYAANAKGLGTTAVGYAANANGCGTALGSWASAATNNATAVGYAANAKGLGTTAVGHAAKGNGCGTALGFLANATANYATALGSWANATGNNATAVGASANATGTYTTALGAYAVTSNANSIQLGNASSLSSITSKVSITVTSDERDKTDIAEIENGAVEFLKKVRAIRYVFNHREMYIDEDNLSEEDKEKKSKYGLCVYDKKNHAAGIKKGKRIRVGVLAQNTQEALKEVYGDSSYANLVNDNLFDFNPDEIPEDVESQLSANYEGFVPFLIKAVQEIAERLEAVENGEKGV